jgi:hypothetical protein
MKKNTNGVHAAPATAQPVKGRQDSITYKHKKNFYFEVRKLLYIIDQ